MGDFNWSVLKIRDLQLSPLDILILRACERGATVLDLRQVSADYGLSSPRGYFYDCVRLLIENSLLERIGEWEETIYLTTPKGKEFLKKHQEFESEGTFESMVEDNTYEYLNPVQAALLSVCEGGATYDELKDVYEEWKDRGAWNHVDEEIRYFHSQKWIEFLGNNFWEEAVYLLTDKGKRLLRKFERESGSGTV